MTYIGENDETRNAFSRVARFGWHATLAGGVLAAVLGVVVLAWPNRTLEVLGVLFGIYLLIIGIAQVVSVAGGEVTGGMRTLGFVSGALSILLGLFCFRGAFQSIVLLGIWIGVSWLIRGTSITIAALDAPPVPGRGWAMFFGVVTALAGVVLIVNPVTSIATLAVIAGIMLLVLGILEIARALALRSQEQASSAP
jgi:uncharacterized membrane protein HdeD (DUF308 family)